MHSLYNFKTGREVYVVFSLTFQKNSFITGKMSRIKFAHFLSVKTKWFLFLAEYTKR